MIVVSFIYFGELQIHIHAIFHFNTRTILFYIIIFLLKRFIEQKKKKKNK